jgi:hypothetical protein
LIAISNAEAGRSLGSTDSACMITRSSCGSTLGASVDGFGSTVVAAGRLNPSEPTSNS